VRVVGYAFRWAIPDVQVQKVENGYITVQSPTNGRCVRACVTGQASPAQISQWMRGGFQQQQQKDLGRSSVKEQKPTRYGGIVLVERHPARAGGRG